MHLCEVPKKKAIVPFRTRSNRSLEDCVRYVCKKYRWQLRRKGGDRAFYISAIVVAAMAGEWLHMIAKIAAIAEVFIFSSVIAAITAMVTII